MPSNVAQRPRLPTCPHQPLSQGPGSSSQFQWTKDSNTSRSQWCRWVAKMTSPGFDNVTLKDEMSIKSEPYHMWTNLCNLFCSQTIPTCIHPYTCSIPLWPLWDFGRQVATVALERLQQWRSGRGSKPIKVFQGGPYEKTSTSTAKSKHLVIKFRVVSYSFVILKGQRQILTSNHEHLPFGIILFWDLMPVHQTRNAQCI